jgi:hypothetical protein
MKFKVLLTTIILAIVTSACVSTKLTIKNIDDKAPNLILSKDNTFVITAFSKDKKYGYDKNYPINIFYINTKNDTINQPRFLNALTGPKGEKISYKKLQNCCPFPSKKSESGAGLLEIYEVTWVGQIKPIKLYLNMYEKGILMVPMGFGLAAPKP